MNVTKFSRISPASIGVATGQALHGRRGQLLPFVSFTDHDEASSQQVHLPCRVRVLAMGEQVGLGDAAVIV